VQRIQLARLQARSAGGDVGDVRTACQQSCPAQAIHFGDGQDAGGAMARLRAKPRAFQVLAELGVEPAVTYLARVRPGRAGHGGQS
jgi:molybdopterin-containing oxidoreductase family iron-sulfur binding subunit